ncbi:hypothetical protein [Bacillus mesophilum]|uniref:Uncharacterized protein n=1 Tax=Bacillus mesophilum TaxID=1071718 RepID=A0A7V7RM80_9BACI|nr:hypothetical protein [Bacillus mesophilum]KAB2332478.1 hypothetical protein F7732_10280 [Bacillus mesophilum]
MCLCNWLNPKDHCKDCACKLLKKSGPGWYRILLKGNEFLTVGQNQEFWFSGVIDKNGCALFYYWLPADYTYELHELILDCDCICGFSKVVPNPPPPPPGDCGCETSNQAGNNFNINRGNGANNTTVSINGILLPSNDHGRVRYNGHTCENCFDDNEFTFTYFGADGVPPFTFTAVTFDVPHCPTGEVVITGQGVTNNPQLFGNAPTYILRLNGVMNNKSISLTINGTNTFTASTTQLGNGELVVSNCP